MASLLQCGCHAVKANRQPSLSGRVCQVERRWGCHGTCASCRRWRRCVGRVSHLWRLVCACKLLRLKTRAVKPPARWESLCNDHCGTRNSVHHQKIGSPRLGMSASVRCRRVHGAWSASGVLAPRIDFLMLNLAFRTRRNEQNVMLLGSF